MLERQAAAMQCLEEEGEEATATAGASSSSGPTQSDPQGDIPTSDRSDHDESPLSSARRPPSKRAARGKRMAERHLYLIELILYGKMHQ